MAYDIVRTAGDSEDTLDFQILRRLSDNSTEAVPLLGATVTLKVWDSVTGATLTHFNYCDITAFITEATEGLIDVELTSDQISDLVAGLYYMKLRVVKSGLQRGYPNDLVGGQVVDKLTLLVNAS